MLVSSPEDFNHLEIRLASPDRIRFWSYGEVEKPETINYRTFKPERKGLFCERIFGPVKDWECSCGKYRRVRYRGIVCERCGVQVTHSKVRRERMGHLELASPVSHVWFLKGIPSYIGLLMDMTVRQLEEVIYYDSYIVTHIDSSLKEVVGVGKLLNSEEYYELKEQHGDKVKADMGARAIKELLSQIDLQQLIKDLRESLSEIKGQKRLKVTKRLKIVEALFHSGNRPEWMIMDVIPIMPPDLRPMVQLEGGRFATSDLNDLYRRVVNRNNRLKRLIDIGAPEMIVRNEKRMLQEAVDVLISNGKRGRAVTGTNGRPLKSLGNIIEGKQGRFRQNLLGKRVDYSGRSVIVVGPHLKFHQCGLPKDMALELFKPFVIRKLVERDIVTNVKSAKRKIENRESEVWDVLEEVITGQPVLLNRAPTLHRLGIQAFEPVLVEGSAIQIHPLVCTAFNADFDGDQMAIHVPLSLEAQAECRLLMMSTNNILSPSNGRPIVTPTQDMVLGCYILTFKIGDDKKTTNVFSNYHEVIRAMDAKAVNMHTPIYMRNGKDKVKTTVGRVIFNSAIWEIFDEFGLGREAFINETIGKKQLSNLIFSWFNAYGIDVVSKLADTLKGVGFKYATLSGISIAVDDLIVPKKKQEILIKAEEEIEAIENDNKQNLSDEELHLRTNEVWRHATSEISNEMEKEFGQLNNIFIMANSGARGNIDQVRQLAGMRGLMSDARGRTIRVPIKSNFKEGLSLAEYFISCYGARKGLVDTALRTADSGYLTRRLVDVAQDVTITEIDCRTEEGTVLEPLIEGTSVIIPISEMIEGRVALEPVSHPETNELLVNIGDQISVNQAVKVQNAGVKSVKVRGIYTCKSQKGICQKCYGIDLATGKMVNLGEAVGIIAAQSIGEPGTQLTMRTFHTGGVDLRKASRVLISAKREGVIRINADTKISKLPESTSWVVTESTNLELVTNNKDVEEYLLPLGSKLYVKNGQKVKASDLLGEYDPIDQYLISQHDGKVKFINIELTKDKKETYSATGGEIFVYDPKNLKDYVIPEEFASQLKKGKRLRAGTEVTPKITITEGGIIQNIVSNKTEKKKQTSTVTVSVGNSYLVNVGTNIYCADGDSLKKGDLIAMERISLGDASKTKDIVQGLPRVEELFEARRSRDNAILCDVDGVVDIYERDNNRVVLVMNPDGSSKEYKVPQDVRIKVYPGQEIEKGDQITDGVINPHDLLSTKGVNAVQKFLVLEVQKVYRSQGVSINNKHIEVIVRQMTRKINIVDMGDSEFLPNEYIDEKRLVKVNTQLESEGKEPAKGKHILLGITRASLNTESFISASSFQETAKVLSKAAVNGEKDEMYGLKENVIIGKLVPAGTGFSEYQNVKLKSSTGASLEVNEEDVAFTADTAV